MINMAERELKMKVCLLGDPAVGKTSLIKKFVLDKFDDKYISTLGTKVTKKSFSFSLADNEINMTLMIWDVLGQSQFKNVLLSAYQGAKGAMVVCDVTRKETLEHMDKWIKELFETSGPLPLVILANKCDLKNKHTFTEEDLEAVARKYKAPSYFTSAKTGDHVDQAFSGIGHEMAKVALGIKKAHKPSEEKEDVPAEGSGELDKISSLTDVEDYIIARFCNAMGGQDFAMPIIRQQFKREGMDFRTPELDKIKKISDNLVNVLTDFKSEEDANKLKRDFKKAINKFESQNKQ